jgi:hypothetical protein
MQPVDVGGIPFKFSAMLAGTDSLDLVVLVDTVEDGPEERIRQEVDGLARVLDVAGSRRPLTVVLIGPRWRELTERAIARVARVLVCEVVVGGDAKAALRDALAVLLPLDVDVEPTPDTSSEFWPNVRSRLEAAVDDGDLRAVLAMAPKGTELVRDAMVRYLSAPMEPLVDE